MFCPVLLSPAAFVKSSRRVRGGKSPGVHLLTLSLRMCCRTVPSMSRKMAVFHRHGQFAIAVAFFCSIDA